MIIELEQELAIFKQTVVRFIEKDIAPFYQSWEEQGIIPKALYRKMAQEGLLCCDLPLEYGGFGVSIHFNMMVMEEIAKAGFVSLTANLIVHSDIAAHYLLNIGSEAQKQKYLAKMASGECIGAICMTEPGAGSDLQGIKTTAKKVSDGWSISGSKTFITNGQNASLYIVAAKTNTEVAGAKGITLFLVDGDKAGFARGRNLDKLGQHASDTSELFFDNVIVTEADVLGKPDQGFSGLMNELPRERLVCACGGVGHAEGAMALALDYIKEREAFGAPLAKIQDIRQKIADMATQIELHRIMIEHYKNLLTEKKLTAEQAAMAKYSCTEMEGKVVDMALQMFGGYGYMKEYPISRFYVDARVQRIYGGASEIMKEIIGHGLIGRL
ncbi:acyl-CoA dehydrogenase family protein [Thalassomonas haliotis]|uniref:Acyl-CoA dehydrogenase family protein n=1 Tax=Thalassomonas haliotis TaxID=485448 RepID=A0ABY7VKJ7_9GAMM|nr:acyl-CoA dehydrogenase family protein [Thalassomonas haliotis]WDE13525.1 acyl-CoA dehydrogenase family protein [Thalassomonas haliotis]